MGEYSKYRKTLAYIRVTWFAFSWNVRGTIAEILIELARWIAP